MADVKWIKIVTDIFDDEKMLLIDGLPERDAIIVIWFKLLCLAGKQNNGGVFMLNDKIAYTDEMLATILRRPLNTVRLALKTFEQFGMVEIINDTITIPNWEKHQSLDSYEKKKERDRLYQKERRNKQKMLTEKKSSDESSDVAISEEDIEEDIDIDIDIEKEINKEKDVSTNRIHTRHKYGEYKNVLLSDEDMEKLKSEFPDWEERIENLSYYIASSGRKYADHLATIRCWARNDKQNSSAPQNDCGDNVFLAIAKEEGIV